MNRNVLIGVGAVIVIVLFVGLWFFGTYNSLIAQEQGVDGQWAQVQTVLQRRYDLIPNLVSTIKGFTSQELAIYNEITDARAQYSNSPSVDTANSLESTLSKLLLLVEDNPEIKSNVNFLNLQEQLEGTENRISVERMRYNDAVRKFNTSIKQVPGRFVANFYGFVEKDFFESVAGADVPPVVDFS